MATAADPSSSFLVAFGERLCQLRTARGWTQAELGERVGMSREFIGLLERGRHGMNLRSLEKFATVFGLTVRRLMPAGDADGPGSDYVVATHDLRSTGFTLGPGRDGYDPRRLVVFRDGSQGVALLVPTTGEFVAAIEDAADVDIDVEG